MKGRALLFDEHSVLWRRVGDARTLPFLGRAFLLQAAHPTIGAGVGEHSAFQADPVGRFQHSFGRVLDVIYAADAERVGAEVRAYHRQIRGVTADGRRYSAYEPEAYFWVLATGFDNMVAVAERFMRPLTGEEKRRGYAEIRELGLRFGLRERDMPAGLAEFEEWYAWVLAERLEANDTVRAVLATYRRPNPPRGLPQLAWLLPREPAGRLLWLASVGTLTPAVRAKLGVGWSRLDAAEFEVAGAAFKRLAALPDGWFRLPQARAAYARVRAAEAAAHPELLAA